MKVIAFAGSPRRDGNTDTLLKEALRGTKEAGAGAARVFRLDEMDIAPCRHCGECEDTGVCVIEDDMAEIYGAIREAERVILASPVFFFGVSAQAKIMIDRCQALWCEKYLLKRPIPEGPLGRKGLFITVGALKRTVGVECSEATAKAFFRTIGVPVHKTLSRLGFDEKGAILKDPSALKEAYEAGRELAS